MKNKIALITGAADQRGIGFACARALLDKGATVVITDIPTRQQEIDDVVTVLGAKAHGFALDVTNEAQVQAIAAQVERNIGSIDVLINNAGTGVGAKPLMECTTQDWTMSWTVNVLGTVNCCKAVIPQMQASGGGVIINNSSASGLRAMPAYGAYAADKHALIGLTRTLAGELGGQNIRVVAICPGVINTSMNDLQIAKLADEHAATKEAIESAMGDASGMKRIGQPIEVGRVAAFLASDEASYMNGNAVEVTGGLISGGIN